MKTIFLFFASISTLFLVDLDTITNALEKGNVEVLANHFDTAIEISILNKEGLYNKTTGRQVLQDFFAKNQPSKFKQVHKGLSDGKKSIYCIGDLVTNTKTYRVYLFMKIEGDKYAIQELRFDNQ